MTRRARWVPWTLAALAYAGFVVSAYLTIVHYRGYVSPCYVVQGCETVQTSKYSVILGVPVALAGAVFFGLLFYLAVGLLRSSALTLVRVFKVLAFLGALAIIPLFLLQAIVLKAFCTLLHRDRGPDARHLGAELPARGAGPERRAARGRRRAPRPDADEAGRAGGPAAARPARLPSAIGVTS